MRAPIWGGSIAGAGENKICFFLEKCWRGHGARLSKVGTAFIFYYDEPESKRRKEKQRRVLAALAFDGLRHPFAFIAVRMYCAK